MANASSSILWNFNIIEALRAELLNSFEQNKITLYILMTPRVLACISRIVCIIFDVDKCMTSLGSSLLKRIGGQKIYGFSNTHQQMSIINCKNTTLSLIGPLQDYRHFPSLCRIFHCSAVIFSWNEIGYVGGLKWFYPTGGNRFDFRSLKITLLRNDLVNDFALKAKDAIKLKNIKPLKQKCN